MANIKGNTIKAELEIMAGEQEEIAREREFARDWEAKDFHADMIREGRKLLREWRRKEIDTFGWWEIKIGT